MSKRNNNSAIYIFSLILLLSIAKSNSEKAPIITTEEWVPLPDPGNP